MEVAQAMASRSTASSPGSSRPGMFLTTPPADYQEQARGRIPMRRLGERRGGRGLRRLPRLDRVQLRDGADARASAEGCPLGFEVRSERDGAVVDRHGRQPAGQRAPPRRRCGDRGPSSTRSPPTPSVRAVVLDRRRPAFHGRRRHRASSARSTATAPSAMCSAIQAMQDAIGLPAAAGDRGDQRAPPSAAGASSRWRATSASPSERRRSASPR